MGVVEADIQAAMDKAAHASGAQDFEVYDDCWASVMFFQRVCSQWNYVVASKASGFGSFVFSVRAGLRYEAVEAAMRMLSVPRKARARLFEDLLVMEQAVVHHETKAA